jgi:hypothetical protein
LNSSIETLSRKTNKTKLLEIKQTWDEDNNYKKRKRSFTTSGPSKDSSNFSSLTTNDEGKSIASVGSSSSLQNIIHCILQPQSPDVNKVIAVTLHESSQNEFPCWENDNNSSEIPSLDSIQICFFLGAVRDMYKEENRILRQICDQNHVPLLRIRLGPVPEFTSKILSVLAYHASNHPLVPMGCERIIARNQRPTNHFSAESTAKSVHNDPIVLHFICQVPTSSDTVTTSLHQRNRIMWSMVRCTVTSLWRSRVAGGRKNDDDDDDQRVTTTHNVPPTNRLSFIFNDGVVLTMDQKDLVVDMAANHQAAPSEYQILSTIRKKLDTLLVQNNEVKKAISMDPSKLQNSLFYDTKQNHLNSVSTCIDLMAPKEPSLTNFYFYKSMKYEIESTLTVDKQPTPLSHVVAVCMALRPDIDTSNSVSPDALAAQGLLRTKIHKGIVDACKINANEKRFIHISGHQLLNMDDCVDEQGASITMIQHLAYQGRLINLCHQLAKHERQKR